MSCGSWLILVLALALAAPAAPAQSQESPEAQSAPAEAQAQQGPQPPAEPAPAQPAAATEGVAAQRTQLNLLGQEDTKSGESRRNENVQFNLVDTNAAQELNIRLGVTATIVTEFQPGRDYYGAEYGARPSPPLALPPSRGAQSPHGNIFWTHGNSVFSARSFFQVGDVQPANENNYGFRVTTPLWKGAALSLNGTQQKVRGQVNGNVLVPLPDERTPLATDPALRDLVEDLLGLYPGEIPNRSDIDPRMLNTNALQRIDTNSATMRLDQAVGAEDKLAFSYAFTSQGVDAFQLVKGRNPDTDIKSHRPRFTWTRSWSPKTVTTVSAGFDRIGSLLIPSPDNFGPTLSVGSQIEGVGPSPLIPVDRALNTYRYGAGLTRSFSKHTLQAGMQLNRIQLNGVEQQAMRGTIGFTNNFGRTAIENFLYGEPTTLFITVGNYHRGLRSWANQFYLADSWKATSKLTLNLGLRYEYVTRPREVNNFETLPYSCDCNNWGPRFGFAYRLGDQWGVLRSAFGISYGEIYPVTYAQFRLNAPNVVRLVITNPDLLDPLAGVDPNNLPVGTRSTLFDFADNLVEPYAHQYSFSWEFPLARSTNLQLGYVGSRAHKVFQAWFLNRAERPEGIAVTSGTVNQRRSDARYNDVLRLHNASVAYYDAARVSLVMRDLKGFTVDAGYWFSKSIDLGSDYTNTMNGGDARRAQSQTATNILSDVKSLSFFDQPHAFLLSVAYETPKISGAAGWLNRVFGSWRIAAVSLLKSGTPFSVETGSDAPGFGNVDGAQGDRPHILDPSILGRTIGDPDTSTQLLPSSAFAFIGPDELAGSLGLRTFRKGKIANVNASLSRSWAMAAETKMTLRAESVNFFNTPQFADPNTSLTSPSFGRITNTLNDGRTFRFTLQFDF